MNKQMNLEVLKQMEKTLFLDLKVKKKKEQVLKDLKLDLIKYLVIIQKFQKDKYLQLKMNMNMIENKLYLIVKGILHLY